MQISRKSFFAIGEDIQIPLEQLQAFWGKLEKQSTPSSEAGSFAKYLYYLGAMIIIAAMTWLMGTVWEVFGGGGIFLISVAYALGFLFLGNSLWKKPEMRIPGGLLITCAVCMVPLAIYGLEVYFNVFSLDQSGEQYNEFYKWVEGKWIYMELGTIIAGILALYIYPFPFITAPIFYAIWFLSMDIAPFILGADLSWDDRAWISLFFGLAVILVGLFTDIKKKEDFAFWGYLFGTLSFWGGLNALVWSKGNIALFVYVIINLIMMVLSIILKRKVLMVFGAVGLFAYLSYLAFDLFADSALLPFAMSLVGLAIIFLGILYQKNQDAIEHKVQGLFPWLSNKL